jgi:hypothetical protein
VDLQVELGLSYLLTRRRHERRLATDEIPTAFHRPGYEPEPKPFEEVSAGHLVLAP